MNRLNSLLLFFTLSFSIYGQSLMHTTFDNLNPANNDSGWYFEPVTPYSPPDRGEWTISTSGSFNESPPSATYNWNPANQSGFANYSGHYLYSRVIDVVDSTYAQVEFKIALDGYNTPVGHSNGMKVEFQSDGGNWTTVLQYEISNASGATVDMAQTLIILIAGILMT